MQNASDISKGIDSQHIGVALAQHDPAKWRCTWRVEKRLGDWTDEQIAAGIAPAPYEVVEVEGNLLLTAGITLLWNLLIGAGGTVYSNANAYIGVGDSSTAEAAAQTDLQAASNKLRKGMVATYPQVSTNTITFQSTFASAEANWAWNEWGVFNASTAGTMLNRKVATMGTKAAGSTWTFTGTISLS